jgi:hypothetical protein
MTEFPKGVRLAQQGDERRIFDLFAMAHAENGFGDMDPAVVHAAIAKGCNREGVVIALIDGPERIEATLGLMAEKKWYCTDAPKNWYWTDMLLYVHPLHRRSRHALRLFQFARWWQSKIQMPVTLGVMAREEGDRKKKLFERQGREIGTVYEIGASSA